MKLLASRVEIDARCDGGELAWVCRGRGRGSNRRFGIILIEREAGERSLCAVRETLMGGDEMMKFLYKWEIVIGFLVVILNIYIYRHTQLLYKNIPLILDLYS